MYDWLVKFGTNLVFMRCTEWMARWFAVPMIWKESYIMFEGAVVAAAMVNEMKRKEDIADRRAFYGPDLSPSQEVPRRKVRLPRFMRRGSNLA
jgi:hypothetical protein